jgi:hypothetical protein
MRNTAMTALLLAVPIFAADVSGKWSGSFGSDSSSSQPIYLIVKQDGGRLTGSGGPSSSDQRPIQNGKVEGDRLTFEIEAGKGTLVFDLRTVRNELEGDLQLRSPEGTRVAKVSLRKAEDH